jgi:hypothetical protein
MKGSSTACPKTSGSARNCRQIRSRRIAVSFDTMDFIYFTFTAKSINKCFSYFICNKINMQYSGNLN